MSWRRVEQARNVYDKIAQLRVVDAAPRRRLPGPVGFSVARIDADNIKSGEVCNRDIRRRLEPAAEADMQKLLASLGALSAVATNASVGRCCGHTLENLFDARLTRPRLL